jgi:uncharacterized membrane protein YdbT with pleckstrin-like domain
MNRELVAFVDSRRSVEVVVVVVVVLVVVLLLLLSYLLSACGFDMEFIQYSLHSSNETIGCREPRALLKAESD